MKKILIFMAVAGLLVVLFSAQPPMAQEKKPTMSKTCAQCHKEEPGTLWGTVGVISQKAQSIQLTAGAVWVVKFDKETKLIGWPDGIAKLPKDKEIAVKVEEREGEFYAKEISVKQPSRVPPEKVATTEFVAEHVEKGTAFIVDSRPAVRYYEGAIPGAINIYDAEFEKHIDKLPKDKNQLIIFYCMGPT